MNLSDSGRFSPSASHPWGIVVIFPDKVSHAITWMKSRKSARVAILANAKATNNPIQNYAIARWCGS